MFFTFLTFITHYITSDNISTQPIKSNFFYFIEITLGADLTPTVYQAWKDGVWGDWETTNNCYLNMEVI